MLRSRDHFLVSISVSLSYGLINPAGGRDESPSSLPITGAMTGSNWHRSVTLWPAYTVDKRRAGRQQVVWHPQVKDALNCVGAQRRQAYVQPVGNRRRGPCYFCPRQTEQKTSNSCKSGDNCVHVYAAFIHEKRLRAPVIAHTWSCWLLLAYLLTYSSLLIYCVVPELNWIIITEVNFESIDTMSSTAGDNN